MDEEMYCTLSVCAVIVPLNKAFDPVIEPLTINEPDICTSFPAACIRLLLLPSSVPLPIIKAEGTDDTELYWPCTC